MRVGIDPELIAGQFGLGRVSSVSGPVARGEKGQVFRLQSSSGDWAVKELFEVVDEADLGEGVEFSEAARMAGVPTPAVVRTGSGQVLLDLRTDAEPSQVRVFEWVDLCEPDQFLDVQLVGRTVARLHQVSYVGRTPTDPWYAEVVGRRRWEQIAGRLADAAAPFAGEFAALADQTIVTEGFFQPAKALRTCHRDLFSDNLRATTDGQLCIIDWEDCGLADPSQEMCLVLFDFGVDDPDRWAGLYGAYLAAGGPGRVDGPGDFSSLIAQLGHILARAGDRWLAAAPDDPERARMAELVAQTVAQPLTEGAIHQMLSAVAGVE